MSVYCPAEHYGAMPCEDRGCRKHYDEAGRYLLYLPVEAVLDGNSERMGR